MKKPQRSLISLRAAAPIPSPHGIQAAVGFFSRSYGHVFRDTTRLMGARKDAKPILLVWSALVESSAGVDPLGLALRVGARLTSELLHCITSITPRARYFSFLPWCISDYRSREAGRKGARGLRRAIQIREHALVLGCVLHHEGVACDGGALTGSEEAQEWFKQGIPARPDVGSRRFSKNPALAAYFGSLVNLGLIRPTEEQIEDSDEERELTFDDLELSVLGQRVADAYARAVRTVPASEKIAASDTCAREELREWGRHGGLCEVRLAQAPDRAALRELFLSRDGTNDQRPFRQDTLLLLLHFADTFADLGYSLDAFSFNDATYFGCLVDLTSEEPPQPVAWPDALTDIALRWRAYHFHHFCWFVLENMFAGVVAEARAADPTGTTFEALMAEIESRAAASEAAEALGLDSTTALAKITPTDLWKMCGFHGAPMTSAGSERWNESIGARHTLSEARLEDLLRWKTFGFGAKALLNLVLLLSSLARYRRWEETDYGNWLFRHAENDPLLDVTTPQVLRVFREQSDDFTRTPLGQLAGLVLRRFVIRQHEAMAFTKSHDGSRAFFHTDQGRIFVRAEKAWEPKQDNGRFRAAVRILVDLGYLGPDPDFEGAFRRTPDGEAFLHTELAALARK
jgi:hypothetical protein